MKIKPLFLILILSALLFSCKSHFQIKNDIAIYQEALLKSIEVLSEDIEKLRETDTLILSNYNDVVSPLIFDEKNGYCHDRNNQVFQKISGQELDGKILKYTNESSSKIGLNFSDFIEKTASEELLLVSSFCFRNECDFFSIVFTVDKKGAVLFKEKRRLVISAHGKFF